MKRFTFLTSEKLKNLFINIVLMLIFIFSMSINQKVKALTNKPTQFFENSGMVSTVQNFNLNADDAKEFKNAVNTMRASSDAIIQAKAVHIESLVYNLQPKIYIKGGIEKTFEETAPICAEVDAQSVSKLKEADPLFSQVEMITIKINSPEELNFVLDFQTLQSFGMLKYVNFLCSFNCDPALINKSFTNDSEKGITVFYTISISE
jgi:hypothetical protein